MATTNKIATVWDAFFAHMKGLEGQTDAESSSPIRKVAEGEAHRDTYPVPFVTLRVTKITRKNRWDSGWTWDITVCLRVVTECPETDEATFELLRKIAQVQNQIDAFTLPDGVTGFDQSEWGTTYDGPADAPGAEAVGDSTLNFTVNVASGAN